MMRRQARDSDVDAVYAIYTHDKVIPYLGFDAMPRADFQGVFDALLASGRFYVVEAGGSVRGFYQALRREGRAAHVACLGAVAVDPAEHGAGLASAMLEEAIAILRSEGVRRVELTLEADNPRALRFYQKLGFEQEGRLRAAYRRAGESGDVDQCLMAMLLTD